MRLRIFRPVVGIVLASALLCGVLSGCGIAGGTSADATGTPTVVGVPTLSTPPTPRPVTPSALSTSAPTRGAVAATSPVAIATSAPSSSGGGGGGGEGRVYVVEEGDTLAIIATKEYGDASLWQKIYDANKDVIGPDPDKIQVGMKLKIPPKS